MDREKTKLLIDRYIGRLLRESTPLRPIWNQELVLAGGGYSWSYVNALFLTALLKLYRRQGDEKYLAFADRFMDEYVREDGSIRTFSKEEYNIDSVCGGTVLLDLYELTGKNKYRLAAEELADQLLGGICLVAGLGGQGQRRDGSYAYYISEPVAENDGKGVGPFLLAYGEL